MPAKKTAFSDVKNLMGNPNTPGIPSKSSGLKKPIFGSQFKASNPVKVTPIETKASAPSAARLKKNYKPRIDLSAIDYSDNEPHVACISSAQRDFLSNFWSAASSSFDVYQDDIEPVKARPIDLPQLHYLGSDSASSVEAMPNLFDDIPPFSFSTFNDL